MPAPSAVAMYKAFTQKVGLAPNQIQLYGSAKGFWIGDVSLKDVLVYFVGKPAPNCQHRGRSLSI